MTILTSDITFASGYGYRMASGEVLDLNGHTIRCTPGDPGTAVTFGVEARGSNQVIKNGKITGCYFGVHGANSTNLRLENVDFTDNTYIGANLGSATGAHVEFCTFAQIVGYNLAAYAIGINGTGSNSTIINNMFSELYRQPGAAPGIGGVGVGILISNNGSNNLIMDNSIINTLAEEDNIGISIGDACLDQLIENNTIQNFVKGILASGSGSMEAKFNGLDLTSALAGSIGIQGDNGCHIGNTISGYETDILGTIGACTVPQPDLSIADDSVVEGQNASVLVSLSEASSEIVTVDYSTSNGTATVTEDYTSASGTLTFNPGETTKTIAIATIDDSVEEGDETFFVNLANPVNAVILDSQATVTITDNDAPIPPPSQIALRKYVAGLNPLMLNSRTLRFEIGQCAWSGGNPDGYMVNTSNTELSIDVIGLWGLDRTITAGWWHLWAVGKTETGENGLTLSLSETQGGLILPDGQPISQSTWNRIRKLPYAVRIISPSAGMKKQIVVGWHSPCEVIYQAAGSEQDVSFSTGGSWERRSLQPLIPKNARVSILDISGNASVRTPGVGDGGPQINGQARREIANSSTGEIEVNGTATVRVAGYKIQETY